MNTLLTIYHCPLSKSLIFLSFVFSLSARHSWISTHFIKTLQLKDWFTNNTKKKKKKKKKKTQMQTLVSLFVRALRYRSQPQ